MGSLFVNGRASTAPKKGRGEGDGKREGEGYPKRLDHVCIV